MQRPCTQPCLAKDLPFHQQSPNRTSLYWYIIASPYHHLVSYMHLGNNMRRSCRFRTILQHAWSSGADRRRQLPRNSHRDEYRIAMVPFQRSCKSQMSRSRHLCTSHDLMPGMSHRRQWSLRSDRLSLLNCDEAASELVTYRWKLPQDLP